MEKWSKLQQQINELEKEKEALTNSVAILQTELDHARHHRIAMREKASLSVRWTHDMTERVITILVRDGLDMGIVIDVPEEALYQRGVAAAKFPHYPVPRRDQ